MAFYVRIVFMESAVQNPKLIVAVLYGGRSGEHEVSLRSAGSVISHLDRNEFEILPIGIDREGRWHLNSLDHCDASNLVISTPGSQEVVFLSSWGSRRGKLKSISTDQPIVEVDIIFPVLHGPLYEDGALQGAMELSGIPFVGCGVLASSVGMDKDFTKRIINGCPEVEPVPYLSIYRRHWDQDPGLFEEKVVRDLGLPVFVKPANLGSSVGIHLVKNKENLRSSISDAFRFDDKILVEKGLSIREIELAVLEDSEDSADPIKVSLPGEIRPRDGFYSYEVKYLDESGAELYAPADLPIEIVERSQRIARNVFELLECSGLARVDLFYEESSGKIYFNEINTMPGFTSISMYPRLWEVTKVDYKTLLHKLILTALDRFKTRNSLVRQWS